MGNRWAFAASCWTLCALGLTGCPTVDLGDTPSDIGSCNPAKGMSYFISDIEPKYFKLTDTTNGCARSSMCHDQGGHGLILARAPVDDAANYKATTGGAYLNCGQPMASELLTRPLAGVDGHGGGDIFADTSDPAVQTFLNWFTQ